MHIRQIAAAILLAVLLSVSSSPAWADIGPDHLLLIVNRQQPVGRELAERYAALRHVPADRIVEIDVPDRDDVPAEVYEASIANVVRQQVADRGLRASVRCLVTFYGVPLRVLDRTVTPAERVEARDVVQPMLEPLLEQARQTVERMETIARDADPAYRPLGIAMDNSDQARSRGTHAERAIVTAVTAGLPGDRGPSIRNRLIAAQQMLARMPALATLPPPPATTQPADPRLREWLTQPGSAAARREARRATYETGNVFALLTLLERQRDYLTAGQGEASVDSELACVFLGPTYPRTRWLANPFHHSGQNAPLRANFVHTSRIDGPTPEIARRIIENSVAVEATGLQGDAVIDARGIADGNGVHGSYDAYDRSLRAAAALFENVDGLPRTFDDGDDLLPDGTSDRAAIYSGWYRLRSYAPTVRLVPGSVAFHVASLELMSLHSPGETGWCRGLMMDGADVTLGAVGEPYLLAFPPADEFLGLLLTGRPTLVEAYWATVPCASWKLALIGDPLYRPFARNPVLDPSRLPDRLRRIVD